MSERVRGLTFYVVFGQHGGYGFKRESLVDGRRMWRLVLGRVGFTVAMFDAEQFLFMASRAIARATTEGEG